MSEKAPSPKDNHDAPSRGIATPALKDLADSHWSYRVEADGTRIYDRYLGPGPLSNPETGETIERERPGSPYVDFDVTQDNMNELVALYSQDITQRLDDDLGRYPYLAPELIPLQSDIEHYMLLRFQDEGRLNIWDVNNELQQEYGRTPYYFTAAVSNFVSRLQLEVKTVEENPPTAHESTQAPLEEAASRRSILKMFLGGGALIAATSVSIIGITEAAKKISIPKSEFAPYFHTVQEDDAAKGPWGIVEQYFPEMSDEKIQEYLYSGAFVNHTATKEGRDPLVVWEGDFIELSQP